MDTVLTVKNVKGYYKMLWGTIKAVDGVSFSVKKGETFGVAGESGSGKSTLARIITVSAKPPLYVEGGEVRLNGGPNILKLPPKELRRVRGKVISFVPQSSMNALNPTKKVRGLILDLMKAHHKAGFSKDEVIKTTVERFEKLGLRKDVLDHYPHELSGGMKQRSVIAISTLFNPKVLIADEPTSALDVSSQKLVLKMMAGLRREKLVESIMFISHDIATLRQICDWCMIMYAGKIVEMGSMEEILHDPLHPYTQGLIASVLTPTPGVRKRSLEGIAGNPPHMRDLPRGCRFHPRCKYRMKRCETDPPVIKIKDRVISCWRLAKK